MIQFYSNNTIKSSPFNSTHYIVLCLQSGDRTVTVDSVTSLDPMYTQGEMNLWSRYVRRFVGITWRNVCS